MSPTHSTRRLFVSHLLIIAALSSGCTTTTAPPPLPPIKAVSPVPDATSNFIPIVRYGRYTLVELAPNAAQRNLLLQVIDVAIPEDARATVGDGLRHVLKRSGYQLCETAQSLVELYSLPLPAAHLHMGPMTLRDALLTLAGSAWDMQVDDRVRQVCFVRASTDSEVSAVSSDRPTAKAGKAALSAGGQP
ncbi:PilL N-terminal domain-containing protein [Pectobacterium polaris]|uniref:PFGI-1 class ICE element type IV pilus protein PilL2 n=1 Tax=Pectobacterium polaris TaxID=2042057 RepID=UPI00202D9B73|nr:MULTISPECIES: PilL N-terminal domain-containing protein [Pectobacterium]MCL6339257.1 integrating conjugative element protein pill, pfgi-1 [Pectobacterium carotovorum subsp. carotovorum]MCL6343516.1 integrating conjugative element protein pill, pfgi-1 [Pectobacterium carotovorum subsp. carotovorum]MDE8756250.1 PilL N-terminal domain-containing protein [Pectobacterium polaris]GKX37626.1 secreted protein [Pectobacterium carotovorum subsp. carotovorum]GLX44177.1 secreted protein [Pectobacterium